MRHLRWRVGLTVSVLLLCGCSGKLSLPRKQSPPPSQQTARDMHVVPQTLGDWARGARLYDGLGDFHRDVTTSSPEAQKFFDQGMRYLWSFNHDESTRSFAKAAELDPHCAMCFWGVALTVGPNYNLPLMAEPRAKVAWAALEQAKQQAPRATAVEQALIAALAKRYDGPRPLDPSNEGPVLTAFADAMAGVAKKFPRDLDVQTLYAESMMNRNPWKLWTPDGKPAPGTRVILTTLESVLARDPRHPGANHYYIHSVEASPNPGRGVAAAERLRGMMPAAGHLEHMPAHIFQRVGRYAEAAEANRKGAEADLAYFAKSTPLDYYRVYTAHNYQFLAYSAAMEGRRADAVHAAKQSRKVVSDEMLAMMPGMDWPLSEAYTARLRFGMWDDLLAEPPPDAKLKALTGGYLYARATALAAKGRLEEAQRVLADLERLAAELPPDAAAGFNSAKDVFAVAIPIVQARIASAENHSTRAIGLLRQAVANEDKLAYDEPSDWFFPVRHVLGAELLKAGKAKEAEAVYRADLKRNPKNGWALYGLTEALRAQKKTAEAAKVEHQFREAWKNADVKLVASAF